MSMPRILTALPLCFFVACGSPTYEGDDKPTQSVEDDDNGQAGQATNGSSGNGGNSGTETGGNDTEPEPSFTPTEGVWTVQAGGVAEDDCGLSDYSDRGAPGSTMDLWVANTSSFNLTFHAGGEELDCDWDDAQDFDCETSYVDDTTPEDYGLDALIEVTMSSTGSFPSADEMLLDTALELDCSGPDCGLVELFMGTSFPCMMLSEAESIAN